MYWLVLCIIFQWDPIQSSEMLSPCRSLPWYWPENWSSLATPGPSGLSPLLSESWALLAGSLSAPWLGTFLRAVSWGHLQASFHFFSSLGDHYLLLPDVQCPENCYFMYFV